MYSNLAKTVLPSPTLALKPFLAVSIENLIPVCPSCNYNKKEHEIGYSSYDKRYETDSLLQFGYYINDLNYLTEKSGIRICVNAKNELFEKNIDVLALNSLYQIHADVVLECIKKGMIYSETYMDNMIANYPELFDSKEEICRILFGSYLNQDDYAKRPLSKMTKDILGEIFETLYGIRLEELMK